MSIIAVLTGAFGICLIIAACIEVWTSRETRPTKREWDELVLPWKVADYYTRIEKVYHDILRERKEPDDAIILWWGLDYLVLSKGVMEWKRKMEPEPKPVRQYSSIPTVPLSSAVAYFPSYPISMPSYVSFTPWVTGGCLQYPVGSISTQEAVANLNRLQTQLAQTCCDIATEQMNQHIVNAINTSCQNRIIQ